MTPETKRAIARIFARARDATTVVGTGFLVSSDGLVLTAFHVIGNRQAALQQGLPAVHSAIELQFDGEIARIACELVDGCFNPLDDWALLRLARVPANLTPIPLGLISDLDTGSLPRIETYGYPLVSRTSDAGMVVSGLIQDKDARYQGAWAYQLFSESAGAGLGTVLQGLSGAPLLLEGAAVGIVRSVLIAVQAGSSTTAAGTIYACPLATETLQSSCASRLPTLDPVRGLPGLPQGKLPAEPFRYLQWYGSEHSEVYFGRNAKIRQIFQGITGADCRDVMLLYGASGVGKSSLLAAGLVPRLSSSHHVHMVRCGPTQAVDEVFADALRVTRQRGGILPVVIVMDQVEQAFSNAGRDGSAELARLATSILRVSNECPSGSLRIVLGFREEWLASVRGRFDRLALAYAETHLERLDAKEISDVVNGVTGTSRLRTAYRTDIDEGLDVDISHDLLSDPKSPISPLLSIILTRLWAGGQAHGGRRRLKRSTFNEKMRGLLDLRVFLEEQIEEVAVRFPVHESSGLINDILYRHTSDAGAGEIGDVEIKTLYRHLPASEIRAVIRELLDRSLLHTSMAASGMSPSDAGVPVATRLAHDTLAPLVRARFASSIRIGQRALRILESRVRDWESNPSELVDLDPAAIAVVKAGQEGMRAPTPRELELLANSEDRAAIEQRRAKRRRAAATVAVGLVLGGALLAFWFEVRARSEVAGRLYAQAEISISEKDFRSAEVLLATAIRRNDQEEYRTRLADIRLNTPALLSQRSFQACSFLDVSSKGDRAACTMQHENRVRIVRLPAGDVVAEIDVVDPSIATFVAGSDDRLVVAANQTLTVWLLKDGRAERIKDKKARSRVWAVKACGIEPRILFSEQEYSTVWASDGESAVLQIGETSSPLKALAFSPDCDRIAAGGSGNVVYSWRLENGSWRKLEPFRRQLDDVLSVAVTQSGLVASGSADTSVRIFNSENGVEQRRFVGHRGEVLSLAFSADEKLLISASADQTLKVWDIATGSVLHTIRDYDAFYDGVRFLANDHRKILSINTNKSVRQWDLQNDRYGFVVEDSAALSSVAFHPTENLLASAGDDQPDKWSKPPLTRRSDVRLWDLGTRQVVRSFTGNESPILHVEFSADGKLLASAARDGTIHLWDAASGATMASPPTHERKEAWGLSFTGVDATTSLFSAGRDGIVKVWNPVRGLPRNQFAVILRSSEPEDIVGFAVSASRKMPGGHEDDRLLAAGGKAVSIWSVNEQRPSDLRLLGEFANERGIWTTAFDANATYAAAGSADRSVYVYDLSDVSHVRERRLPWHHAGTVTSVAFCADKLLSIANDGILSIARPPDWSSHVTLHVHTVPSWWVACHPKGNLVATAALNGEIRIINLASVFQAFDEDPKSILERSERFTRLTVSKSRNGLVECTLGSDGRCIGVRAH